MQEKKIAILHIDDNPDDLNILKLLLPQHLDGAELLSSQGGEKALKMLEEQTIECIICDYQMPGMNGLEVLQYIRSNDSDIPFIFLTGQGNEDVAAEALRKGADDYMSKGIGTAFYQRLGNTVLRLVRERNERRKFDEAVTQLKVSESKYRSLFQNSKDVVFVTSLEGEILEVNGSGLELFGFSEREIIDVNVRDLYRNPQDRDRFVGLLKQQGFVKEFETEYLRKDKSSFAATITASLHNDKNGGMNTIQGIIRDISHFRDVEKRLQEQKDSLDRQAREKELLYNLAVLLRDIDQPLEKFLKKCIDLINGLFSEVETGVYICIADKTQQTSHYCQNDEYIKAEITSNNTAFGDIRLSRSTDTASDTAVFRADEVGFLEACSEQIAAFLERRYVSLALRESEKRLQSIFENVPVGLYRTDASGRILLANRALVEMLGYSSLEELQSRNLADNSYFGPGFDRKRFLEDLQTRGRLINQDSEWMTRDGSRIIVSESVNVVRERAGEVQYIEGVVEDVTGKRLMESEIAQAQKMQAIGQLAAGIAHEINTPIQYIADNTNFLKTAFEKLHSLIDPLQKTAGMEHGELSEKALAELSETLRSSNVHHIFAEIPGAIKDTIEGVSSVSRIVQAMKRFSHPGSDEMQDVDINKLVESVATISRNEWKYVADLTCRFAEDLPSVACLPRELNQVILNLIINAAHAIEDRVDVENGDKGEICLQTCLDDAAECVQIQVHDTGCGIPESVRERIFEPFFTTKDLGKGTGQGLAIAYNIIVDKHCGSIKVDSVEGKGTSFTISLPLNNHAERECAEMIG